ncbi:MAG: outer membrane beta-barrel protein [Bacteroidales bacterium]|nr:outer membrane beta-barrel protein [Bacteroidales bacterium]
MKKLSATLIATLCLWTLGILTSQILYAQTRSHLEYAFGHVIETSLGCAFTCNDNGFVPGPELNLRYTYYWGKHFGVYGHIGGSISPKSVTSTFSKLDDSYNYAPLQYRNKKIRESYQSIVAGLAYRLDFGAWSFRPRIGLGYGEYKCKDYSYYRISSASTSDTPERVVIQTKRPNSSIPGNVCFNANIQMAYSPTNHFFIFAEISGTVIPGIVNVCESIYTTESLTSDNWFEGFVNLFYEPYRVKELIRQDETQRQIGGTVSLRFGIGWNIGLNRNTRHM